MARLTRLILLLFTIFTLLLTMIRTTAAPSDPVFAAAFQRDPTCPQPCWHGIQLGITSVDDAYKILQTDLSSFSAINRSEETYITWQLASLPHVDASLVHLFGRPGNDAQAVRFSFNISAMMWDKAKKFTLADAIHIWGTPLGSSIFYCTYGDADRAMMMIWFAGNIRATSVELFNDWRDNPVPDLVHVTPDLQLAFIEYFSDSNNMVPRPARTWNGFKDRREDSLKYYNLC
ncbi:MAG: hypothetical protein KF716_29405 [Anaerolineae bacterium]|nr:hypothetical protein [Anaerolineae bacterium]